VDKIPMPPGEGMQPNFIISIGPPTVKFDPPATITYPNGDGLKPGEQTTFYSFDHDLGTYVSIGTGTVSEDGATVTSDPGFGIVKGGWHCAGQGQESGEAEPPSIKLERFGLPGKNEVCPDQQINVSATTSPKPGHTDWQSSGSIVSSTDDLATVTFGNPGAQTVSAKWTCNSGQSADDELSFQVKERLLKIEGDLSSCANRVKNPDFTPPAPNGCGAVDGTDYNPLFPYFRSACDKHDGCYDGCGNQRSGCENAFPGELAGACSAEFSGNPLAYGACLINALELAIILSAAGGHAYEASQRDACLCPCLDKK